MTKTLSQMIAELHADRPLVEAFCNLTLARVRERHPSVTMDDISITIEVDVRPHVGNLHGAMYLGAHTILGEMNK